MTSSRFRIWCLLFLTSLLTVPGAALAQQATPVASPVAGNVQTVAAGLTNPRGFIWGPDGTLYVAMAGSGGSSPATETAPATEFPGPFHGGPTGAIVQIDQTGCPTVVVDGLPSTITVTGEVLGAEDVAFLGGQLYAGVDGGGPVHGNQLPAGIYRINDDQTFDVIADLSAWLRDNPTAKLPPDYDPDADGYRMVADEASGVLWVLEPNAGGVLTVTADGTVTRVADLSADHPVPASIALAPGGGVYIGMLTQAPFTDGSAKVIKVAADGTVTDVWTGLTTVTGLAVGPDGTLYAAELSTGNLSEPPFLVPGSGKVVHQTGPDSSEEVATGLTLPIALGFGPDGGMYVSVPAIGANQGDGVIVRVSGGTMSGAAPSCAPVGSTVATPTAATPVA